MFRLYDCWAVLSFFFFFKQKTAYEMRISDWSSDGCSSDLLGGLVRDGVKAGIKEVAIHHVADRAIAGRCHPNRHTGHDNLGDWRVDHPLAPELVEEAACIAEQADPDILAIEDHTIVALHFFMKRFVDSMDEAPLSHWRTYPQKHGRQGEEDHSKHR